MIDKSEFGRTGHQSTRILFGAAALGRVTAAEADRTFELLYQYGINHIDTAASYGDSELHVGRWMERHRKDFFLATKTGERTYQKAYAEIQLSLDRLRTNQIDLIQLHNLVSPDEWETAFDDGGALEAAKDARRKGYVRFIGVTGHGMSVPRRHLASLEQYPFDSVLLPYNVNFMGNEAYAQSMNRLLETCRERRVAVQTIKSIARGRWGDKERHRSTWYEPLEAQDEIDGAIHYVLSEPGVFINSAGDIDLLPKVLDAASRFSAETDRQALKSQLDAADLAPLFPDGGDQI